MVWADCSVWKVNGYIIKDKGNVEYGNMESYIRNSSGSGNQKRTGAGVIYKPVEEIKDDE